MAKQNRKGELDHLQTEFQATESVLRQELFQDQEELENKGSELKKKDFELQVASQGLEAANRLAKGDKTELDHERIAFQSEKDDFLRELEQALADKAKAKKQGDEDVRGCRRRSRFSSS